MTRRLVATLATALAVAGCSPTPEPEPYLPGVCQEAIDAALQVYPAVYITMEREVPAYETELDMYAELETADALAYDCLKLMKEYQR